jgi:hypothetical protein
MQTAMDASTAMMLRVGDPAIVPPRLLQEAESGRENSNLTFRSAPVALPPTAERPVERA